MLALGHAERLDVHHDRVLVEDPHHDALAVDRRQRHDAQVDVVAVDGQADAPVLRDPPLGDVELGHDLDPRDDAGSHPSRDRRQVVEDAVDAQPDPQVLTVGRQVQIRGPRLDGLSDELVDEPNDRRVVGRLPQVDDLDRVVVLAATARLDDVAEARQTRDHRLDVLVRRDRLTDLVAGHDRDVVDRDDVRRVGHRHEQRPLVDEARPAAPRSAWRP